MVRNVLGALSRAGSVTHVALVTGLKHYLGPFEAYGKGALPPPGHDVIGGRRPFFGDSDTAARRLRPQPAARLALTRPGPLLHSLSA